MEVTEGYCPELQEPEFNRANIFEVNFWLPWEIQDTNVEESVQPLPLVVQQRAAPMNKRKMWRKFDVINLHESFTEFKGKLDGRNIIDASNNI